MRIISPRVRAALCFLLSLLLLLLCACGSPEAEKEAQPTVIEQGAANIEIDSVTDMDEIELDLTDEPFDEDDKPDFGDDEDEEEDEDDEEDEEE